MSTMQSILSIPTAKLRVLFNDLQVQGRINANLNPTTASKIDLAKTLEFAIDAGALTLADIGLGGSQPAPSGTDIKALQGDLITLNGRIDATLLDLTGLKCDTHANTVLLNQLNAALGASMSDVDAIRDTLADVAQSVGKQAGAVVDPATVSAEVARVVADAFKPLREMVEDKGLAGEVAEVFAIAPTETISPATLFKLPEVAGLPDAVIYNDATAPATDPLFVWQPAIVRHLMQSQVTGENVWLGGEKGTGKTQTVMQFAALTGRSFTRINFHKYTTAEEYLGAGALKEGNTCFEAGDFLKAYTRAGSVILLDEISNADAGELAPLNALLEPNAAVNIGGKVWRRAEGVLIFGADNTLGNGDASGRYAGVRQMNAALLDRFARSVSFAFLPREVERQALMNHTKCTAKLADTVLNVVDICRKQLQTGALVDAPSLRQAIAFIRALPFHGVRDAWLTTIASKQPIEGAIELEAIYTAHVNTKSFTV